MRKKPPKGTHVYDSGDRTIDRYTIIFPKAEMAMSLSLNPDSPQGFSQWGCFTEGSHLGKRISWDDMPQRVREHALKRWYGDDPNRIRFKATVDVRYLMNGVGPIELAMLLKESLTSLFGEGRITGETEAEIEQWGVSVKEVKDGS